MNQHERGGESAREAIQTNTTGAREPRAPQETQDHQLDGGALASSPLRRSSGRHAYVRVKRDSFPTRMSNYCSSDRVVTTGNSRE